MSSSDSPTFTTLDVAKHNSANDAWIIVGGKVLDITAWVDDHPGGDAVLLDSAGRDATREFEDVGHSDDARTHLKKLIIGTIRPATNEELRIAKSSGDPDAEKKRPSSALLFEISKWVDDHSSQIKRASAASAAAIVVMYIAKRYIAPYFTRSRR